MMPKRIAVVMAGGSGERFWPLSRADRPKQLLALTHPTKTMLVESVERAAAVVGVQNVFLSTSGALEGAVRASGVLPEERILAEPARRNTLGALCWVVANLIAQGEEKATVAVVTSDHMIGEPERFVATVSHAMDVAEAEHGIVTIGIRPTRPETGYGYIEFDPEVTLATESGRLAYWSKSFREKPTYETALDFVESGCFLWNAGMFFFEITTFLEELRKAQPEAADLLFEIVVALEAGHGREAGMAFERLPNISVDYAVMERAERVLVVPSDFPWDDVGSWDALSRTLPTDEEGNVVHGDAVVLDSSDCIVLNEDAGAVVALLGGRDLVVVRTRDAVLVCPRDRAQEVRRVTNEVARRATRVP